MSEITGIKFRPVMGPEERIKATVQSNGYMYVATDTGNMYLDVNNHRISIGGASGSGGSGSTGFVWASADEELGSIVKATDDYSDGDPVFYFNPSAIDDGIVPKIDTLILNSDGRFFRVVDVNSPLEGFITVELIAVSGGGEGGGGGGSSTVDLDLSWSGIDLLGATYIYEKDAEITFIPNSLADEICSLSITVTDATGAEVYKKDFRVNNNTRCVINASNFPVSNNLTLTALVKSDHSTYNRGNGLSKTFKPIKVFKMYLEKPTDLPMMGIVSTAASLAYIPYYTGLWTQQNPVKLYYNVDGGDQILGVSLLEGNDKNQQSVAIPHQVHGTHIIGLWLSVVINEVEYTSEPIYYEVPFKDAGNEDPIIWIKEELGTVVQYEPAVVNYMIYSSVAADTGLDIPVQFLQDGVLFDEAEIVYSNKWQTLDLTSRYVVGENHFSIVSGGTRKDIDFNITSQGARLLDLKYPDDLELNLNSIGRTNKQIKSNRTNFTSSSTPKFASSPYSAQLNGFNWYNNGWLDDNDGNGSYLSVSNGASVTIPMPNITVNSNDYPWTFEMRFRIRNAKKFTTLVTEIPIYEWIKQDGTPSVTGEELTEEEIIARGGTVKIDSDGNKVMNEENTTRKEVRTDKYIAFKYLNNLNQGFAIGAQEAYFNAGGKVVNVKYREDEIINISFVVNTPKSQLLIYLNGILSGVGNLSGIRAFNMDSIPFTINSEYCDFDLYKFRIYSRVLDMPDIIHNYISDIKNVDLYDENQLADINNATKLSYHRLIEYNENHQDSPTMPYIVIDMTNAASGSTDLPFAKSASGIDGTRIEFHNPTGDYELQQWLDEKFNDRNERLGITPYNYYTHCPSYSANNVNINVQGTSSQIYPRRNFKTKFKKAKQWIYTYGPLAGCPVTYSYYFNTDGSLADNLLEESLSIQAEIAEIDAIKVPTAEQTARKAELQAQLSSLGAGKKTLSKDWHEDSELFGSNKFTWKIDYMESSGSYNTGFANLMGNNVYKENDEIHHPLDDIGFSGEGYRTTVYGFPMLAFHKTAEDTYTYIGRYNYNLDKSSNERYGFELKQNHPYVSGKKIKDVAECWELRDNQGYWCSFRYPTAARAERFATPIDGNTNIGVEVARHFEARYHVNADEFEYAQNIILDKSNDSDYSAEIGGTDKETANNYVLPRLHNLQVLFDWLDSTDPKAVTNLPLSEVIGESSVTFRVSGQVSNEEATAQGITYSLDGSNRRIGTFTKDSKEYRRQKFYAEFDKHLNKHYCAVYFVMTELLLCYDSRGKNMMLATFGPQEEGGDYIWYPIFYDIDTQLGLNNVGALLWGYDEDCTENKTFSTGESVLWMNFYDLFKESIVSTYRQLRSGVDTSILSYRNIEGAYDCDPAVFSESTAMRGRRPLIAMGLDEYYKYVLPITEPYLDQTGQPATKNYLYACQGDRKLSRELLLNNRLLYMDSKWLAGEFTINTGGMAGIMFRSTANKERTTSDKYIDLVNSEGYEPGDTVTVSLENSETHQMEDRSFVYMPYKTGAAKYLDSDPQYKVTPYLNFYITTFVDENTFQTDEAYSEEKYPNGIPTKITASVSEGYQYGSVDQQLNYFAGSSYISSLGDLSTKYVNQVEIPKTPRLLDITLGSDAPGYFYNDKLDPFNLYMDIDEQTGQPTENSKKPLLSKIILSNIRSITKPDRDIIDARSASKLTEFRALGTFLSTILFAEGAPLSIVHLPSTMERLIFVQNKNLTRILTSAPTVADMVNGSLVYRDPATYSGLYVAGVTDFVDTPANRGQGSSIYEIDMEGDAMNYDSYTILNNIVLQKLGTGRGNRLSIKMTDVNWTPYTQVEYGENKQVGVDYYILTDHSTYEPYDRPGSEWADDTLNGKIYTFDETMPKATISDLSLLDIFLSDYTETMSGVNQFTNNVESEMGNKTYPTLSGNIFVANGEAESGISETDLSRVYGAAWPNLVIRAEKVEKSFLTKYVEIDPNTHKEVVLDNKTFNDTDEIGLAPATRLKVPTRTHYDFIGFSPNHPDQSGEPTLYVVRNANDTDWELTEAGAAAHIDANTKSITLYAIFVPHVYTVTFKYTDGTIIDEVGTAYGQHIQLPTTVPHLDESSLPLERKYAFLGYAQSPDSTRAQDTDTINLNRNMTLYAIFQQVNVYDKPIDSKYIAKLSITINGVQGWSIGLNNEYSYSGKITLPSWIDGKPVLRVMQGDEGQFMAQTNGISWDGGWDAYNNKKNHITHIFWDTQSGVPSLKQISNSAFKGCQSLQYVDIPSTVDEIGASAFEACSANISYINASLIGASAFYASENQDFVSGIAETLTLGPNVQSIGMNAFSQVLTLKHLVIGSEQEASRLSFVSDDVLLYCANLVDIVAYTSDTSAAVWQSSGLLCAPRVNEVTTVLV